tara:strand:- start:374 stop:574 length:201 start_codon:yes stop_codon:yes gene_type:complete
MLIERKSMVSGKVHAMDLDVTQEQMDAWSAGMYIQDAMPQLSDGEREFLMTGITQEEWDATFGEEE